MKKLLFFMLFLVSIPILIINYFYTYRGVDIVTGFENNTIKKKENNLTIRVLDSNNEIKELNIEDYLVGVVSSEVPVSFEKEALKAQAVASRTYALRHTNCFTLSSISRLGVSSFFVLGKISSSDGSNNPK